MKSKAKFLTVWVAFWTPFVLANRALAADGGAIAIENFIKSIIGIFSGLAGVVAVGFIVVGGYQYVTSANNPEKLDSAKRTLICSGVGLAIIIGANVIVNIVAEAARGAFGA